MGERGRGAINPFPPRSQKNLTGGTMLYSSENYTFLFENEELTAVEQLQHHHVANYRTKVTKAGDWLECEIYPIWRTNSQRRRAAEKTTRKAQENLNKKTAAKRLNQIICENFTAGKDLYLTFTYSGRPPDPDQIYKDTRNYFRRLRTHCTRQGMQEPKYIYTIGIDSKKKTRGHVHIILSGVLMKTALALWNKKCRKHASPLEPDDETAYMEIAQYFLMDTEHGHRRRGSSRNLIIPKSRTSDRRIGKRRVEKLVTDFRAEPEEILESEFKGYNLKNCTIFFSDYVAGAYIRARLRKIENNNKGSGK